MSETQSVSSGRETVLDRVGSISIPVSVRLCRRRMSLGEFVALGPGSFIPFPTPCDQPVELRVEGRMVAVGEAVRHGSRWGIRLNRIVAESAHP